MRVRTCLNRKLGNCNCAIDYEPITTEHPYNNLTCPMYKESYFFIVEVIDKGGKNETLGRKISS